MCIEIVKWVLEQDPSILKTGPRFVLAVLAEAADRNGRCWPSQSTIARRTAMTRRSVINHITWLCEHGWVRKIHRYTSENNYTSNDYFISFPPEIIKQPPSENSSHPSEIISLPCENSSPGGGENSSHPSETVSLGVVKQFHTEPSLRTLKEKRLLVDTTSADEKPSAEDRQASLSPPPKKSSPSKRGTRWQEDKPVPDDWITWAEGERPDLDVKKVALVFADHWPSQPGQKGAKVDWKRTWKNWVRSESKPAMLKRGNNGSNRYENKAQRNERISNKIRADLARSLDEENLDRCPVRQDDGDLRQPLARGLSKRGNY